MLNLKIDVLLLQAEAETLQKDLSLCRKSVVFLSYNLFWVAEVEKKKSPKPLRSQGFFMVDTY